MTDDKRAIETLVATWMEASIAGDTETVLGLMADDVIFMVPGRDPFGKDEFRAASEAMKGVRMEGTCDIKEIEILGDRAFLRSFIDVNFTPVGGDTMRRSGYTLSILRKEADGRWLLLRDANLVM
ncbi:MAG TPA: SgcJ/EcaC family oxidoreductase [Rhizomicrobium sp.]|jgi:uncharacterized protein (TIGR02246 family)